MNDLTHDSLSSSASPRLRYLRHLMTSQVKSMSMTASPFALLIEVGRGCCRPEAAFCSDATADGASCSTMAVTPSLSITALAISLSLTVGSSESPELCTSGTATGGDVPDASMFGSD